MLFDASFYFPQWQGSPFPEGIKLGGQCLFRALKETISFHTITVDDVASQPQHNIWHYPSLKANMARACAALGDAAPRTVFMLGGDCSADVPVIDYLHSVYPDTLGVVWIDAHTDIHTPQSSTSYYFHGMPVRTLLGEGDEAILQLLQAPLSVSQICYAGIRSIDPPEAQYIAEHRIPVLTSDDINRGDYQAFSSWRKANNIRHLHIHLDLDALDPGADISVTYRIENGIAFNAMADFLRFLHGQGMTVGLTLTEYAPKAESVEEIGKITRLLSSIIPLRKILAA